MSTTLNQFALDTPIGSLEIFYNFAGVTIVDFADNAHRIRRILDRFYADTPIAHDCLHDDIAGKFERYFDGTLDALDDIAVAPAGSTFDRRVWQALRSMRPGRTHSYRDLASMVESSPRAVGGANGRNPIALVIPCHRVIGADGSLTGYAGGIERKHWLLTHEGVVQPRPKAAA